jgi:hypothetical protein
LAKTQKIGLIVLLVVIVFSIVSVVILFRSSSTGRYVDATSAKIYIFNEPRIRDTRHLYCPKGTFFTTMTGMSLEAQMNAGRKCTPSPYVAEFPHLTEYYCCGPVFKERYIDELPRDPTTHLQ